MKFIKSAAAAVLITAAMGGAAQASPASDAFGKCLVESSTGKDRIVFMQWFFAALSANPNVSSLTKVTPEQRVAINRQVADLIQRLVLSDCHAQAVAAIREDGDTAVSASFEVFGRAAAGELMSDPAVGKEMSGVDGYLDKARWDALMNEAKKK